jgi:hypothetical protein
MSAIDLGGKFVAKLAALAFSRSPVVNGDTALAALGKLQGQINFMRGSAATLTNNTAVTTETVVARWSVAANTLQALDNLKLDLAGQVSATATLTFRIRFGTAGTSADALLATFTTSAAGVANAYHSLSALVSVLTSTTATATGTSTLGAGVVGNATAAFAAATVNLAVANFLSVTLVQSVAQTYTSRAASLTT